MLPQLLLALKIAFRSFVRHGRRSFIAGTAVALSLAMMLFSKGMGDDGRARMKDMGVRMGSGHVLVEHPDYRTEQSASAAVGNLPALIEKAKQMDGVQYVAPRLLSSGLITHGAKSAAVVLHAGLPEVEVETNDVAGKKARVLGEYVKPRGSREFQNVPGDIYLGDGLSEKLDARIGDRIVVTIAPPGGGDPRAAAFYVSGTFHTAVTEVDRGMAHIDLDDARELLGVGEVATQVAVLLEEQEMVPRVTQELKAALSDRSDVVVRPWQEVLVELHEALVIDEASNQILMSVIFFIVTLGIFNSILMSVTERTRELGVQKALGTSGRRIFTYVMMEAFILAVVSAAVGVGLGLGVHFYMAKHGLNVGAMMEGDYEFSGIAFNGYIYSRLTPSGVAFWAGITILLVLLSALYPAYRAARQVPVEAMRHV